MCRFHRRDWGPFAKAVFQTRPLAVSDPTPLTAAATCHSYRRRAPHPLAPLRIRT